MEKVYRNTSLLFIVILVVILWGFYRTYFGLFPNFNGISNVQHIHGILFLIWFGFLIVQPLLIRYNKPVLHRKIGSLSYVIVPILLLSIFLVSKEQYHRMATIIPKEQNLGGMALNIPDIFAFAALYILAMINKKNTAYHMRYMIATSLLLIGPGAGRAFIIYGGMPFPQGVLFAIILSEVLAAVFLLTDIANRKPFQPYLVTLLIFIGLHLCWHFQMSAWWQIFAGTFANVFF